MRRSCSQVARIAALYGAVFLLAHGAGAQILPLPPRPPGAPTGTQFTNIITRLSRGERENWIYAQIISGNVPDWLRTLQPVSVSASISGTNHTATYQVTPDYLAVGSATDYFLTPMTPILAQRLCDRLGFTLPTRRMVNQIWTNATVKMNPQSIIPSPEMITVPVFAAHNFMVRTQRDATTNVHPPGALLAGHKKDIVISTRIYTNFAQPAITHPVVIFGWHYASGAPIQPLYNGHEETYADYSHGVRLVQMNLSLDGLPGTVTNVLTTPGLAALLSDDDAAPHVVPRPGYTVAPLSPIIMAHPRSQTVPPGAVATMNLLSIGDSPLAYHWQRDGTNILSSTAPMLTLTNSQATNAGVYSAIVTNASGAATSRPALFKVTATAPPPLFEDDFETESAARWQLHWGAADGIPDFTTNWAFDHAAVPYTFNGVTQLVPAAPHSPGDSTRSLRISVNANDLNAQTAGVNLFPRDRVFTANFTLKFDLWINYPGAAGGLNATGSTQHALCGLNHLGTQVNWASAVAASSDGVWCALDGEGGTSRDYRAYEGNPLGTPIELIGPAASGLGQSNNTAGTFPTLFPAGRCESVGAPGKGWVQVELRQTNNAIQWLLDDTLVAERTNTTIFTNGQVMIGLMDVFASIANPSGESYVLFDNVRVECLNSNPARFESVRRLPGGEVQLAFNGVPCATYTIEAATAVPDPAWEDLGVVSPAAGAVTFTDTNAAARSLRFYRARQH